MIASLPKKTNCAALMSAIEKQRINE